jgi:hypothetical protein
MKVEMQHVPFVEIAVHERLLALLSFPIRSQTSRASPPNGQEPVTPVVSQRDVLDGIPKILSLRRIGEKTPVDLDPDHVFFQAVPGLHNDQFKAIPATDDDLNPPLHLQAIAATAALHMPTVEQSRIEPLSIKD